MPDPQTSAPRLARCACGSTTPSTSRDAIAFFEDRTPGSYWASVRCNTCRYAPIAHDRFSGKLMDGVLCGSWPPGVPPHEFTPTVTAADFDGYYCGHAGWD